jgi:hypothetical protein
MLDNMVAERKFSGPSIKEGISMNSHHHRELGLQGRCQGGRVDTWEFSG